MLSAGHTRGLRTKARAGLGLNVERQACRLLVIVDAKLGVTI